MIASVSRTLRYTRAWLSQRADVVEDEIEVDRGDRRVEATLHRPAGGRGGLPSWIVLHGITVPGRSHPSLVRFARALASTGSVVLVPDVPEWRTLHLAPERTLPTIRGSLETLADVPAASGAPPGLVGFSFGAPQAIAALGDADVSPGLAGAAAFGGYADLPRTVRFLFTGEHELDGRSWKARPDPYGRWILGANYLTHVPGHGEAGDVAGALHELAYEAGRARVPAWDPRYDETIAGLRRRVAPDRRDLYDLFAPPADAEPDGPRAREMAEALAAAARRVEPRVDPGPFLDDVRGPLEILHGRNDRLIPFTESLRLARRLPPSAGARVTVTGLFAHSSGHRPGPLLERFREGARFLAAIGRVLAVV